jgi:hypothetical protein
MKTLNDYPLLGSYCGGQADECSGINMETWEGLNCFLPPGVTEEMAEAAEKQIQASGMTKREVWHYAYERVCEMPYGVTGNESHEFYDPKFPLAWEISGLFF